MNHQEVSPTTVTYADGNDHIAALWPGSYTITETQPANDSETWTRPAAWMETWLTTRAKHRPRA